jgi:SAM-dependent methyltransferase
VSKNYTLPTAEVFDAVAPFWAEIADASATQPQVALVKSVVKPVGWVLDLACGTARHALPLLQAGYCMVGLDVSRRLLQIAKHRAAQTKTDLPLVQADMQHLPFRLGSLSAVVSVDQSLGYLPTQEADAAALKEVAACLEPEGVLLIDVFNGVYMTQRYAKNRSLTAKWALWLLPWIPFLDGLFRWHSYHSFQLMYTRTVDAKTGFLCDVWVFRSNATGKVSLAKHVTRLYDRLQLEALVAAAGLHAHEVYGGYSREEYGADSKRLIIVASKSQN